MNKIYYHIDEVSWNNFTEKEWGPLRWKDLLNEKQGDSKEFVFGYAALNSGERLPLHTHKQAETDFILSGKARVWLGRRSVELGPASGMYFPAKGPHSIEAIGPESLCYIYTYACEKLGQNLETELATEEKAAQVDILNNPKTRWAVAEEFEPWVPWEPSKGFKGMCIRDLFDLERGSCKEMMVGTCMLSPGAHYTLHYHDQPEIYYPLSGRGIVYVGDSKIEAFPGIAIYVGKRVVHGADTLGTEALRMFWIYGTETTGQNFNWTPVEDIYTEVK